MWSGSASRSRSEAHQQAFDIRHRAGHDDVCASRVQVCMVARIVFRPEFLLVIHVGVPGGEGIRTLLYGSKGSGVARQPPPDEDYRAAFGANPANNLLKAVRNIAGRRKEQIPIVAAELDDRELRKRRYPLINSVNGITRRGARDALVGYRHVPTSRTQGAFQLGRICLRH